MGILFGGEFSVFVALLFFRRLFELEKGIAFLTKKGMKKVTICDIINPFIFKSKDNKRKKDIIGGKLT